MLDPPPPRKEKNGWPTPNQKIKTDCTTKYAAQSYSKFYTILFREESDGQVLPKSNGMLQFTE